MLAIYRTADKVRERLRQTDGKLAVTLLAVVCLTNILFVALSC